MKTSTGILLIMLACINLNAQNVGIGTSAPTAKLHIEGDSNSTEAVITAKADYTGDVDVVAIEATSLPASGWGYGGILQGGYMGVLAWSKGGDYSNTTYGVFGQSTGTTGRRIGIYGLAVGGTENWAGYFDGRGYFRDSLAIGVSSPQERLDVAGGIKLASSSGNNEGTFRYLNGLFEGNTTGTPSGWKAFNGPWVKDMFGNHFLSPAVGNTTVAIGDSMLSTNMKLNVRWDIPMAGGGGVHGMATKNGITIAEGHLGYQYGSFAPFVVSNMGVLGTVHHDSIWSRESFGVAGNNMEQDSCNYGVYGIAQGAGDKNIGVYGSAQNGVDNWAGYFKGNIHVKDSLLVGIELAKANFHVGEGNTVLFGKDTIGNGVSENRLMWLPNKEGAFRVGRLDNVSNGTTFWNPDSIGIASIGIGTNTRSKGLGSVAIGYRCRADNQGALALGYYARAKGISAVAIGPFNRADAMRSFAVGYGNVGGGNPNLWVATDPLFEVGSSSDIEFRQNAFTILKSGNVGIVTHTPSALLHIKQYSDFSNSGIRLEEPIDTNYWETWIDGADDYNFAFNGTLKGYIQDTDGAYIATSDRRLKTKIEPIGSVLGNVRALKPSTYQFIDNNPENKRSIGFIAQEVENLFPVAVSDKDGYLGINYSAFAVIAIQAIKELADDNDVLKNNIATYQNTIEQLEDKVNEMQLQIDLILEEN